MFWIQANNPALAAKSHFDGGGLSSVSRVFVEYTEDAVLVWNRVPILVGYDCSLGEILPEVVDMLEACAAAPEGEQLVRFGSASFRAHWRLRWSAGQLTIHGKWSAVAGAYEALLNERAEISMSLDDFRAEWKAPLERIVHAVDTSGIRLDAGDDGIERLRRLVAALPRHGYRYRAARQ
jgi:hypothetical protein